VPRKPCVDRQHPSLVDDEVPVHEAVGGAHDAFDDQLDRAHVGSRHSSTETSSTGSGNGGSGLAALTDTDSAPKSLKQAVGDRGRTEALQGAEPSASCATSETVSHTAA